MRNKIVLRIAYVFLVLMLITLITYLVIDYNYKNKLKKGDIIAFNDKEAKDGRVVIHRLVEIKKEKGKTYYITKGDANNSTDDTMTTSSNIVGVVKFRIKYLAYPTVYFNNMFTKGVS